MVSNLHSEDDDEGGHAYVVLSAHQVQIENKRTQLMKLKNLDEHFVWTGAWSDEDT